MVSEEGLYVVEKMALLVKINAPGLAEWLGALAALAGAGFSSQHLYQEAHNYLVLYPLWPM